MTLNRNWDVDESDCCGNGCKNCILYTSTRLIESKRINYENKRNCLLSYNDYKLIEKTVLKTNLLELKFQCIPFETSDNLILFIPSGHHVMMKAPDLETLNGNFITRPYSPFWVDEKLLQFKILVNLSPRGKMSKYVEGIQLDEMVKFRGPVGSYQHDKKTCKNLLIFTHGVAIAPVMRIIDEILDDEDDMTRIHLIACFSDLDHVIFRDRINEYRRYWNFNATIYLPHQNCDECENAKDLREICDHFEKKLNYNENVRLSRLHVENLIESCNTLSTNYEIVLSGSKAFINFIENNLKLLKIKDSCISVL